MTLLNALVQLALKIPNGNSKYLVLTSHGMLQQTLDSALRPQEAG
jgi:hypothetical protein